MEQSDTNQTLPEVDGNGNTPLHDFFASVLDGNGTLDSTLLEQMIASGGDSVNVVNASGNTPLDEAIEAMKRGEQGAEEAHALLVKNGAKSHWYAEMEIRNAFVNGQEINDIVSEAHPEIQVRLLTILKDEIARAETNQGKGNKALETMNKTLNVMERSWANRTQGSRNTEKVPPSLGA